MSFEDVLKQQDVVNDAFVQAYKSGNWTKYHEESKTLAATIEKWAKAEKRNRKIRQILEGD